jgi:hypothetical protein
MAGRTSAVRPDKRRTSRLAISHAAASSRLSIFCFLKPNSNVGLRRVIGSRQGSCGRSSIPLRATDGEFQTSD